MEVDAVNLTLFICLISGFFLWMYYKMEVFETFFFVPLFYSKNLFWNLDDIANENSEDHNKK